jgi:hypothetical protein
MDSVPAIDPSKEYRPSEIFNNGWIRNTLGNKNYKFVLRTITTGKLKARNVCQSGTGQAYYRVLGSSILEYLENIKKEHHVITPPLIRDKDSRNSQ